MNATLEHVNVTVEDPAAVAEVLKQLFGWAVRWQGPALDNGFTVHVGTEGSYLALYRPGRGVKPAMPRYTHAGSLAHIGIVVGDLDAAEARVSAAGFEPHSHADYEPGRRFYFDGPGNVEIEVISYA